MKAIYQFICVTAGLILLSAPVTATECSNARVKQDCTVTIDANRKLMPGPVTVVSGTKVTVIVTGMNPLDDVSYKLERSAGTPPENPIASLINLVTGAGIPALLSTTLKAVAEKAAVEEKKVLPAPRLPVEKDLDDLRNRVVERITFLQALAQDYERIASSVGDLYNQMPCQGNETTAPDEAGCRAKAKTVADAIQATTDKGIPSYEDEKELLKNIDRQIEALRVAGSGALSRVISERDAVTGLIEARQTVIAGLKKAQSDMKDTVLALRGAQESGTTVSRHRLPADKNTDTTVHVTLTHLGKDLEVPVVVHYQSWAWATVSAGVAFTNFRRESYSVATSFDAKQTDPAKQTYGVIARKTDLRQAIPVSFVNFQLPRLSWRWDGYDIAPTASVGVGVNVGNQEAEFAVGPGIHMGRVQFTVGAHWARSSNLINGFSEGQKVDPSLAPPVDRPFVRHWSIAITYRVH